ncbi:MAG TPA: hypothetical protein QF836_09270 [Nitrospinota bacterium]|jgi:deoxyhypusine synthase|nr:hypothetical protein [Nitrospinota bacterium]HJN03209.1 hypothetical protein [Nitrospinota bacterium]
MFDKPMFKKLDFNKIKTYPIKERKSKVSINHFVDLKDWQKGDQVEKIFPKTLKANDLKKIADDVVSSVKNAKPVIWGIGAHLIKCGLSTLIIDLMKRKLITALAMNGAGAIHDFEIAFNGETSENVAGEIKEGRFGMVEETGSMMNSALQKHFNEEANLGEMWGKEIAEGDYKHKKYSLLAAGFEFSIPVTVHSAIGTDITHMHPSFDGSKIGQGTYNDFKLLTSIIANLEGGGCFFNIGSSVLLPEVFLKGLSVARNLGHDARGFTTVNMDMIQHYRPKENVISRPTQDGGRGYSITGHHEIMLPLLYQMILSRAE